MLFNGYIPYKYKIKKGTKKYILLTVPEILKGF